jgi:dihydroorotate dehydrogenase
MARYYEHFITKALFSFEPEAVHRLAKLLLANAFPWRLSDDFECPTTLETHVAGIRQAHPIGLAAGFDKDCECLKGLSQLGFGSITVGTITQGVREGNPKPRLVRLPSEFGILDHMGLPSKGADYCAARLKAYSQFRSTRATPPLFVSLGGTSTDEILSLHRQFEAYADAIELDITCPNVAALTYFGEKQNQLECFRQLARMKKKPVFLRLPFWNDDRFRKDLAMTAVENGIDGLTISGGLIKDDSRLALKRGALTGRPIFENTKSYLTYVRERVGGKIPIRIAGGVLDGRDALQLIRMGASSVNVYSAFVFRGPFVAKKLVKELLAEMRHDSI